MAVVEQELQLGDVHAGQRAAAVEDGRPRGPFLSWRGVNFTVASGKDRGQNVILNDVAGEVPGEQVCALSDSR